MAQAAIATIVREMATVIKVSGSVGLMPKSRLRMRRVRAKEVASPIATPARVSFSP